MEPEGFAHGAPAGLERGRSGGSNAASLPGPSAAMSLSIAPIDPVSRPDFAGEVGGIDLSVPLAPESVAAIEAGMDRFAVLVFRDQRLDDARQIAFSANFGPLEQATGDLAQGAERRLSMAVNDISNLDQENRLLARDDRRRLFGLGNRLWHSDSSFKPIPAKYSALSARVIPGAGGNTEFADMRAAYDALDDATRAEIAGLICEHSQLYSRATLGFDTFTNDERRRFAPVPQRLVRCHPVTGRRSLFLASHAGAIRGWPVPEARAFLRDLTEHATQRRFVYAHVWRQWDLVMWDNRVTMHRARPFDPGQVRDMHRTTVADSAPTLEQAA
jgi:alpha-ketoglutarate-dependent 2,4-dichlorophenoxyacetate dioxygenase